MLAMEREYALVCWKCREVLEVGSDVKLCETSRGRRDLLVAVDIPRLRNIMKNAGALKKTLASWLSHHAFHAPEIWHSGLTDYEEPWLAFDNRGDCFVATGWRVGDARRGGDTPLELIPDPLYEAPQPVV
jgi:hypothetical protein